MKNTTILLDNNSNGNLRSSIENTFNLKEIENLKDVNSENQSANNNFSQPIVDQIIKKIKDDLKIESFAIV